jgi:hypothetical protein
MAWAEQGLSSQAFYFLLSSRYLSALHLTAFANRQPISVIVPMCAILVGFIIASKF